MRLSIGTLFLVVLSLIMTGCLSGKGSSSSGNGSGGSGSGNGGNGSGSASLQSVTVQPASPTVAPGDTEQFKAIGHYSDKTTKDLSSQATWTTSDATIATVNSSGLATAVASGSATITASVSGQVSTGKLTVATLSNVAVAPSNPSINPSGTQQFTAKANYSNGEGKDVTSQATWSSSDITIATIDSAGLATATAKPGKTTITATFKGDNGSTVLTVIGITGVVVTPIGPAIGTTSTQQFTATATYNNNTQKDVTTLATWSSSAPAVATVSDVSPTKGLATAVAAGQTEISATYQTFTGMTALNVSGAGFTDADLKGNYAVALTGVDSRGTWFLVGSLNADGAGKIAGIIDTNTKSGVQTAQTVVGSYSVFPDGRADVHFGGSVSGAGSHSLRVVLTGTDPSHVNPATSAQAIEFDTATLSDGKLELQSGGFSASSFSGSYVFGNGGYVPTGNGPLAAIGSFTSDGVSSISGQEDVNNDGTTNNVAVSGSYTAPDANTGRFTATLNGAGFVFYLVSANKAYFMSTDALSLSPVLGGQAETQSATPNLANASYVFLLDHDGTSGQFKAGGIAGQITLNAGNVTGGEQDETGQPNALPVTGGNYTASGGGRYTLCENITSTCDRNFVVYVVSNSPVRFYMLRTDTSATDVQMGTGDQQSQTTVGSGTYALHAAILDSPSDAQADGGLLYIPEGLCAICGIGDRNAASPAPATVSSLTLSGGTFGPVHASGRGTFTLLDPLSNSITYTFYVVTGNKLVVLGESPSTDGVMITQ
ncbi:MAG TPA: Ig-like domain-containing protein [Bryobacteraceae bacterium]|nr:Ig-like domain-containing protein [Bryobacteraceae bacterium]